MMPRGEEIMARQGRGKRTKWGLKLCIILLTVGFLIPAPTPVLALNTDLAIGCTILGLLATPLIGYGVYENLPSRQGKERLLNGEFYTGGFLGAAFTPSQNLQYLSGVTLNRGVNGSVGKVTLFNNQFANALTGGVKLGYFTHAVPYLGLEVESCVNNSYVHRRTLSMSPAIQGATTGTVPNDFWINWTTALHIVGRYGFLPDQEVPFGRLQPYVGIGPAFIVLYEEVDSAKNFGVDVMAGVRYMVLKNLSAFVEYKFNYQWGPEIEDHAFYLPNGTACRNMATLDFANHKIVAGVAYHW
jgi:opacity protein-like surface antigen